MKFLPRIQYLRNIQMGLILFLFFAVAGCATAAHRQTSQTTVQDSGNGTAATTTVPVTNNTTTTSSTTTTTEHHEGAVGTVFHAIGSILAFPFLLIGNILQAIF